MRFSKRIKIFPGFNLNISRSGISSSLGVKGACVNFSKRGAYLNTSIPGLGMHTRHKIHGSSARHAPSFDLDPAAVVSPQLAGEIKSAELGELSSTSFEEFKQTLHEVYNDRMDLTNEFGRTQAKIRFWLNVRIVACVLLIGFFISYFRRKTKELEDYSSDLASQLNECAVDVATYFDEAFDPVYQIVVEKFKTLLTSKVIWDITSSVQQDRVVTRSVASQAVTRTPVSFTFDNISIIRSEKRAFHFENRNGGDLYIYPAFVVITTNQRTFAVVDIKDFNIDVYQQQFLEEEKIPSDTRIIGKTWKKVNKNGTPDKRFKGNYEISIVRYGGIEIKSGTGLNEAYAVSSYEKAEEFISALKEYQQLVAE